MKPLACGLNTQAHKVKFQIVVKTKVPGKAPGKIPGKSNKQSLKVDTKFSLANLDKHASKPFNPDIANTFFRAGLIEAWGRGIERIIGACREAKTPEPLVRYETTSFWLEFPFQKSTVHPSSNSEDKIEAIKNLTQETAKEKILALILDNPLITRRELAEKISLTQDGVKYHLQKLKMLGIIKHIGPTKTGQWKILK